MEHNLIFLKMEDDLNFFERERRPHFFLKIEDYLNVFLKIEDDIIFWKKEDDLNFWKTEGDLKWKTT